MQFLVRAAGWALCVAASTAAHAQYSVTNVGAQASISSSVSNTNASGQTVSVTGVPVSWGWGFASQVQVTNADSSSYLVGNAAPWISPGGFGSNALLINDGGQIAGTSAASYDGTLGPRGFFIHSDGSVLELSNGSEDLRVYGMNQAGYVWGITGQYGDAYYQGFMTGANGVGMSFFGDASGCLSDYCGTFSSIFDVNVYGQAIGSISGQAYLLNSDGSLLTLNSLATLDGGATFTHALDIDDMGRVLARASDGHNYVLAPVSPAPEPGTWALMLAGLAGVAGYTRRRRATSVTPAATA